MQDQRVIPLQEKVNEEGDRRGGRREREEKKGKKKGNANALSLPVTIFMAGREDAVDQVLVAVVWSTIAPRWIPRGQGEGNRSERGGEEENKRKRKARSAK